MPAVDLTTGGDGGARDTGSEDKEAGELGKAFTETEDDEEWVGWVGWVDWDALGGGSGSAQVGGVGGWGSSETGGVQSVRAGRYRVVRGPRDVPDQLLVRGLSELSAQPDFGKRRAP